MEISEDLSAEFLEHQYRRWHEDPDSLSPQWQLFFKGFSMGAAGAAPFSTHDGGVLACQSAMDELVRRHREVGHLLSCLDPLSACPTSHPLLDLPAFGLAPKDLNRSFATDLFAGRSQASLAEILALLRETYCRSLGVEFMHLQDPGERRWLQDRMEPVRNRPVLDSTERRHILFRLLQSTLFEGFLNKKYVGVTRFSLEGGDALIPLLDALIAHASEAGCREVILGMAHRGRLSVQAHVLSRPYAEIFAEFESCYDPHSMVGSGDVKYHNGYLSDLTLKDKREGDRPLRILLVNNPSHLEAVDPVVQGIARARQDLLPEKERFLRVIPILIHGDAAFAGQGVVAETLNMSQLAGYRTGGTLHVVINNQIGYTTLPEDARSTRYATDIAKMLMVPVLHVHGEDPEAVVYTIRLAADYRAAFGKDVVLDLVCYRRYGHNEGDEPYFTLPQMYSRIRSRPPASSLYAQRLLAEGVIDEAGVKAMAAEITPALEAAFAEVHGSACPFPEQRFYESWNGYNGRFSFQDAPATAVAPDTILELARAMARLPEGFSLHPKLQVLVQRRLEAVEKGAGIDWAGAEALAFASLLAQGVPLRLSGQDSARGTFSQRHSSLVDTRSGTPHVPLNSLGEGQARFTVCNSLLAEYGVLGFEYGYSLVRPETLVLWEAQFGDFVNNAQSVIDLFIASGQAKWQRLSGLTLLLPHGLEGLGPEHSSARPERFLQLCADDNLQICHPSTPAQYFHLLRRQALSRTRLPLVVLTPKSLLRHPLAVSDLGELAGGGFQAVLPDPEHPLAPKSVLLCSGKLYFELHQRRRELEDVATAIVRIEQFYPFPEAALAALAKRYRKARRWLWVQEEPENMGAWTFLRPRLEALTGRRLAYVGRSPSSSPATGFPAVYKRQQAAIIEQAAGPARKTQPIQSS